MSRRTSALALSVALAALVPGPARSEEPLMQQLKDRTSSEAFNLGALLQIVGDASGSSWENVNNGFTVANLRVSMSGRLDGGVSYFIQPSFIKAPALLDARLAWGRRNWKLSGGAFKAPFGAELLVSAADIDFVNRSQAVTLLVPGRQVGVELETRFIDDALVLQLGAFNGNGLALENDDDDFLGACRLAYSAKIDDGASVQVGGNFFGSRDTDAPIGVPIGGDFLASGYTGDRIGVGVDARVQGEVWLLAGELIWTRFDPHGANRVEPTGYHLTIGWFVAPKTQLLVRWDSLRPDGVLKDSDVVILGLNHWPTEPAEIQINLLVPTSDSRAARLLVNGQVRY